MFSFWVSNALYTNLCASLCRTAGKTTLLKILAGKHMVGGRDVVRVLNGSAFHDTQFVCSGDLSYLGGSWSRTVGSIVSVRSVYLL
jgi:CCR4-NOT complex subunit CAF16